MDLSIHKDNTGRTKDLWHIKQPYGIRAKQTRSVAISDIMKEVGLSFNRNYLSVESTVLSMEKYPEKYIQI